MTLLIWLTASSLVWGGLLWISARLLQRATNAPGALRQWIWRGATVLLLAPWMAAPFVIMFGLGLAPAESVTTAVTTTTTETLAATPTMDAGPVGAGCAAAVSHGHRDLVGAPPVHAPPAPYSACFGGGFGDLGRL